MKNGVVPPGPALSICPWHVGEKRWKSVLYSVGCWVEEILLCCIPKGLLLWPLSVIDYQGAWESSRSSIRMRHSETRWAEYSFSQLHFLFTYLTSFSGVKDIFTACCSSHPMKILFAWGGIIRIYKSQRPLYSSKESVIPLNLGIPYFFFTLPVHNQCFWHLEILNFPWVFPVLFNLSLCPHWSLPCNVFLSPFPF